MRVVQMRAGVLQIRSGSCRLQCILAEFGGVEVGVMTARMSSMLGALNASAPETVNRSEREASRRK